MSQSIHSIARRAGARRSLRRKGYIPVPNEIIRSSTLYPTDKVLLVTMMGAAYNRRCRKSYDDLAVLSGLSRRAVASSLRRLEAAGLISWTHTHYYNTRLDQIVRSVNLYTIAKLDMDAGYTLIPRTLLGRGLTPAACVAAMEVYAEAGREGRSCGSLRRMARVLDVAKATVCRSLHQFRRRQVISYIRCLFAGKRNHACNSYYPVDFVRPGQFQKNGGLKFALLTGINKITGDGKGKENIYGVAELGKFDKFQGHWVIRVSAEDAPDEISA